MKIKLREYFYKVILISFFFLPIIKKVILISYMVDTGHGVFDTSLVTS